MAAVMTEMLVVRALAGLAALRGAELALPSTNCGLDHIKVVSEPAVNAVSLLDL